MKRVFAAYQQFGQMDIEQAIKTETDPELSRGLMAISNSMTLPFFCSFLILV